MQKRFIVSLALILISCGRSKGPGVPEPTVSSSDVAEGVPDETYQGDREQGSNGIEGPVETGSDDSSSPASAPAETPGTPVVSRSPDPSPKPESNNNPIPAPAPVEDPATPPQSEPELGLNRIITLNPSENRGVWEGWGTTLGAWANGIGTSNFEALYADLLFTQNSVNFIDKTLPGLGLNIVRYNIGAGGRPGDFHNQIEAVDKAPSSESTHDGFEAYRVMEGFWKNPDSDNPESNSFDWSRDANQRSMMQAAKIRGVDTFEFYSAAPMWWMTLEKSASGGALSDTFRQEYMQYLVTVAAYARDHWGIPVNSLEPFNEPSSGKWKYPVLQQACNLKLEQQLTLLGRLRTELNKKALLGKIQIAAADESNPTQGLATLEYMKNHNTGVQATLVRGVDLFDKVNVHTADSAVPFRSRGEREKLRAAAGEKRVWVSEYNDNDSTGLELVQSIIQDMNGIRPRAWIYSQAVEPYSNKGLLIGQYHTMPAEPGIRGKPLKVLGKYFMMAQFTRFIRVGQTIIGSSDEKSILAYSAKTQKLSVVSYNSGAEQNIELDMSKFKSWNANVTMIVTRVDGTKLFTTTAIKANRKKIIWTAEPNSVSSLEISDAVLK